MRSTTSTSSGFPRLLIRPPNALVKNTMLNSVMLSARDSLCPETNDQVATVSETRYIRLPVAWDG